MFKTNRLLRKSNYIARKIAAGGWSRIAIMVLFCSIYHLPDKFLHIKLGCAYITFRCVDSQVCVVCLLKFETEVKNLKDDYH